MERMETNASRWNQASLRGRVFLGAVLALGLLAPSTIAYARPEPIPEPVEEPEPEESPATGQDAPADPEDPPVIEPPEGLPCVEGEDQSNCDPGHPGDPEGKRPGNEPPEVWFDDMAMQMFELQEGLDDMAEWSARHDRYIYYYARWLKSVVQQYYALGYGPGGNPRQYSFGPMTRGDFNYYHYYWVRPLYFNLLYYGAQYYNRGGPQIPDYLDMLQGVASSYHSLVLCNYGFNGNDRGSREDLRAQAAEARAGLQE